MWCLFWTNLYFSYFIICTHRSFSETKEVRHFLPGFLFFLLCLVEVKLNVLSGFVIESVLLWGKCEEHLEKLKKKKKNIPQRKDTKCKDRFWAEERHARCKNYLKKRSHRSPNQGFIMTFFLSCSNAAWRVKCQAFHTGDWLLTWTCDRVSCAALVSVSEITDGDFQ